MKSIIDVGRTAVLEAGEIVMSAYTREKKVYTKKDSSLVSEIDIKAEEAIVSLINDKFPGHAIIGEEGTSQGSLDDYIWIIDPIDGTHNYLRGIPLFGISVGVVRKNEFVAGFLYMPAVSDLYISEKKSGALKNGEKISVSTTEELSKATLSFDSGIKRGRKDKGKILETLGKKFFNMRMFGATSVILTYLAEGKIDAAVDFDDKSWDFAAGASLITEAGGSFTDIYGEKATYKTEGYLATNGKLHNGIIECLNTI